MKRRTDMSKLSLEEQSRKIRQLYRGKPVPDDPQRRILSLINMGSYDDLPEWARKIVNKKGFKGLE